MCSYSGYFFIAFYYNPKIKFNREEDIVPLRRNEEQHAVGGNCSEHKVKLSMRYHKLRSIEGVRFIMKLINDTKVSINLFMRIISINCSKLVVLFVNKIFIYWN